MNNSGQFAHLGPEMDNLLLELIDLLLIGDVDLIRLPYLLQQVRTATTEVFVLEAPPLRALVVAIGDADGDGVGLDLTKAVEIELSHEGGKVVVPEPVWDYLCRERIGVFDDEC